MLKYQTTPEAYRLLHEGQIALAEVEHAGVRVDKGYLDSALKDTRDRIRDLEHRLKEDPIYQRQWKRRFGDKAKLGSRDQIAAVVFGDLKYPVMSMTAGGEEGEGRKRAKADESAFEHVDLPFVRDWVQCEKLKKARSTYLVGIRREMVWHDGAYFVHPSYNLNTVQTYRSSCSDPNWQNIPARIPEFAKMVRRCYIPLTGCQLVEIDYCLHPDTLVEAVGGVKAIREIKRGDLVFSRKGASIAVSTVAQSAQIRKLAAYRVTFDNGESVIASSDHRWPVRIKAVRKPGDPRRVSWTEAVKRTDELVVGERMIPFRRIVNPTNGYCHLYSTCAFDYVKEHVIVAEAVLGSRPAGCHTHHKDENKLNNKPDNLEYLEISTHLSGHSLGNWERMTGAEKRKKVGQLVSNQWRRRSYEGKGNPNYGKGTSVRASCLFCDKEFSRPPSAQARFCSRPCYFSGKKAGLNHRITKIEFIGPQPMHAISVDGEHNFVLACGVVTLNSQIEVRIPCCYNFDPVLIDYVKDPTKDMHRDTAMKLFFLPKQDAATKAVRHVAKNRMVFPTFYGSYYVDCARSIWHEMVSKGVVIERTGVKIADHLASKGIRELGACDPKQRPKAGTFEAHVKKVEDWFWQDQFTVYARWKKDWYAQYLRDGGMQTLTGFAINGHHNRNDVTNYPIQCDAFQCLLWSLVGSVKKLREYKFRSRIIGQIHDCQVGNVHPRERDDYIGLLAEIMTEDILRAWKWITVPLVVEAEVCPIDGSWDTKAVWEIPPEGGTTYRPKDPGKWEEKHGPWQRQLAD
jgi:hypothetical protein